MPLVDMKLSKKETKESRGITAPSLKDEGPQYPWGLSITLEKDALEKLDMDAGDFTVGQIVTIHAEAKVTRLSISSNEKNQSSDVQLQIQKMEISGAKKKASKFKAFAEAQKAGPGGIV